MAGASSSNSEALPGSSDGIPGGQPLQHLTHSAPLAVPFALFQDQSYRQRKGQFGSAHKWLFAFIYLY